MPVTPVTHFFSSNHKRACCSVTLLVLKVLLVRPGDKGKKKIAGPLFQIHWWRVVLDESQAIKNASTLVAHAAHCLQVLNNLLSYCCHKLLSSRKTEADSVQDQGELCSQSPSSSNIVL